MKSPHSLEALESRIAPATLTVTNLSDTGAGSLRAAIAASHSGDTIVFKSSLHGVIHVASTLAIDHSLTINGGNRAITLSGVVHHLGGIQLLNLDDGNAATNSQVTLAGLIVRDGFGFTPDGTAVFEDGGAVQTHEALTISNCAFINNFAGGEGGAVYVAAGAQLTVQNSVFAKNSTAGGSDGGAIYAAQPKSIVISNTSFNDNLAGSNGGAIYIESGSAGYSITNCRFDRNSAEEEGGAAYLAGQGASTLSGCTFSRSGVYSPGPSAGFMDGPSPTLALVVNQGSSVTVSNTVFDSNTTGEAGTVKITGPGSATLDGCKLKNSVSEPLFADERGGGIYFDGGSLTVKNTLIAGNGGDGILFYGGSLTVANSTIRDNHSNPQSGNFYTGYGIRDYATQHGLGTLNIIASIIKGNPLGQVVRF